ncbi:MAG: glucokinase [Polyangiaceae bacterium]
MGSAKRVGVFVVGDIGGTNARLSLVAPDGRTVRQSVFVSRDYSSLESLLREFLGKPAPKVLAAAFGIAGPVVGTRVSATNLPWVIDSRVVSRKLGIPRVTLLNDLVALSLGAHGVPRRKLRLLSDAGPPKKTGANIAVIAAGTGLGEGVLVWDGERFCPCATEGGHTDFAPRTDLEVDLWRFLEKRHGHVSYERILSGDGLGGVYDFFTTEKRVREKRANAEVVAGASDRNAAIAKLGIGRASEAAARAVDLFCEVYGAETGNLALKALAVGGVYVCGNIAYNMLPVLETGGFLKAFVDKGRFASLMGRIPIAVVPDSDVGIAGALHVAMQ